MKHALENKLVEVLQIKKKVKEKKEKAKKAKNENKLINHYPGGWSDAVIMTGHHKNAKSQVE